jgi:hypothetical protein
MLVIILQLRGLSSYITPVLYYSFLVFYAYRISTFT